MPPSGKFGLGQQKPEHFLGAREDVFSQTGKFSVKAGIGFHYFSDGCFLEQPELSRNQVIRPLQMMLYTSVVLGKEQSPAHKNMLSSNCAAATLQPSLDRKPAWGKCCTTEIHLREKWGSRVTLLPAMAQRSRLYIRTMFWGEADTKCITSWSSANYQMDLARLQQLLAIARRCIDLKAKGSDKII